MSGVYRGELLHPMNYDPTKVLPPDEVSEYLGQLAFMAAWWASFLSEEKEFSARVLLPGVGSGIIPAAFLSERKRHVSAHLPFAHFPVHFDAFDLDPEAVAVSEQTLEPYLRADDSVAADVSVANWRDQGTWTARQGPYTTIVMNPPYLTPQRVQTIRAGYEHTPSTALIDTTGNMEGLGEYEYLLPPVARSIRAQPGAALIGRFAVGKYAADTIAGMLYEQFVTSGLHPTAHVNVKSHQSNIWTNKNERRSYSAFLVEPVGMVYSRDGGPVNIYQVPEFIDSSIRDKILPASGPTLWVAR